MVDAWPSDLPQTLNFQGFNYGVGDGRLRSQMDAGPAKVRSRSSAVVNPLSGVMTMTTAQWEDLIEFGITTLERWSLPFEFPDPDGAGDLLVRFSGGLPARAAHGTVGSVWDVSIDLEVLP